MTLLREIAKNTLLAVPWVRRRELRTQLAAGFGQETTSTPEYVREVFSQHRAAVERWRPIQGRVLEIGPGANLANAALFVKAGADEAVCIDVMPWLEHRQPLYDALGIDADVLERVRYECPCAIESAAFPDESFDVILSHACFQRFYDPQAATRNIARMLRPGGVTTHQIDFRDHRDPARPLEFLKTGDLLWRLATSRSYPPNRWRASDVREAFVATGLEVLELDVNLRTEVAPELAASFAPRFRRKTLDDLGALGLFIVARKPSHAGGHAAAYSP